MAYKLQVEKNARRYRIDPETGQQVRVRKIRKGQPFGRLVKRVFILGTTRIVMPYHYTKGYRVGEAQ